MVSFKFTALLTVATLSFSVVAIPVSPNRQAPGSPAAAQSPGELESERSTSHTGSSSSPSGKNSVTGTSTSDSESTADSESSSLNKLNNPGSPRVNIIRPQPIKHPKGTQLNWPSIFGTSLHPGSSSGTKTTAQDKDFDSSLPPRKRLKFGHGVHILQGVGKPGGSAASSGSESTRDPMVTGAMAKVKNVASSAPSGSGGTKPQSPSGSKDTTKDPKDFTKGDDSGSSSP